MTKRKKLLIILAVFLVTLAVAISAADAIGQERERTRQPIPTYTIEIRGAEANDFSVSVEGKYTKPDGEVTEIKKHLLKLPVNFYVNADCSLDLKITTSTKRFIAMAFYEHNDVTRWLAVRKGIAGTGVTFRLKPYDLD